MSYLEAWRNDILFDEMLSCLLNAFHWGNKLRPEVLNWWSLFYPTGDQGQKKLHGRGLRRKDCAGDCQQHQQLGLEWQGTVCDWLLKGHQQRSGGGAEIDELLWCWCLLTPSAPNPVQHCSTTFKAGEIAARASSGICMNVKGSLDD